MAAVTESLKGRHFTRVADWTGEELLRALDLADDLKERQSRRDEHDQAENRLHAQKALMALLIS